MANFVRRKLGIPEEKSPEILAQLQQEVCTPSWLDKLLGYSTFDLSLKHFGEYLKSCRFNSFNGSTL